jgi:polyisoprenoid-binding protein YceI
MLKPLFRFCLSFFFALLSFKGIAQVYSVSTGSILFRSEARLELIKANSNELRGKLDAAKKAFAFTVKMNSFKGFNSPLQREHFNENYLESSHYPDAFFSGKIIEDVDFTKDGEYSIRVKGILNVHGVPQERIIKTAVTIKNGVLNLESAFTVQLSDHNIPIPKVVHEKLASEIKVEVKALMQQQ